MAVVKCNYVQVGSARWGARLSAAMHYYAFRSGDDLVREEDVPEKERHDTGRVFYTSDGEQLPLAEAEGRLFAQVEARRTEHQRQQEAARAERTKATDVAFEDRCKRFVAGEDRRQGRQLSRERRQQLVERWRQTRHAKEQRPDPGVKVYRVVVSTERTVLDGRDGRDVLEAVSRRGQPSESLPWMYVRHDTGSHPHIHALVVTDGRGFNTRDLDRMRETLGEREAVREREQTAVKQRDDGATSGGRQR